MSDKPQKEFVTGRIVTGGSVIDDGVLAFERDRIVYCGPAAGFDPGNAAAVPAGSMILPGLVDMHCHGANGGDFPSGNEQQARAAIGYLHRSGTTTLLASLVTASYPDLLRGVQTLRPLTSEGLLAGIHMEGPFLSRSRCGAQDPQWIRNPDPEFTAELLGAAAGTIKNMTYAPELPGADELVRTLAAAGVVPSLGHTDCDADTAAAALETAERALAATSAAAPVEASAPSELHTPLPATANARRRPTATHLFNGMPPAHHRSPGPVPVCLRAAKAGRAVVELIADNVHLAPQTVLSVFELAGAGNVALVSDSMAAAGLSDGQYSLGPSQVTVRDGVATLDSGSIAGGTATLLQVLQRAVEAGVPLPDAVTAATEVPAAVIGAGSDVGLLAPGYLADAVIVTADWQLQGVLRRGQWLQSPSARNSAEK